ncbi:hypothetical protein PV326_007902 [Microctonus aethiopoides]|nr:hypothetical protein PV326_007902 [Microctonus aethiopoides]
MNLWLSIICVLAFSTIIYGTLSPPTFKQQRNRTKVENKKHPVHLNVQDRFLVVQDPKSSDILKEAGLYCKDTKIRHFTGEILGYITPWNSDGLETAKIFHGKFTVLSPVWLTLSSGNTSKFHITTHDIRKKWLKQIKAFNDHNHTVRILPRVLFENLLPDDVVSLNVDNQRKSQLVSALVEIAKTFYFDGFVLEMWNQLLFTGVKIRLVVDLIKFLSKSLKNENLEVILAIPPARGSTPETFSRVYFNELAPHIDYFSLMTYDFSRVDRPGPNSPIEWVQECVEKLVPDNDDSRRSQILMGLNFYGNDYTPEGGGPIVGWQYLKILETFKGKILYDERSEEHFFEYRSSVGRDYVFYPTLYSINRRIDLARKLGTGLSIWELGQGLNYFYDLF